jgi:thiamine pyrophosphate-dependent acetolactate synthase large subunit-like protein
MTAANDRRWGSDHVADLLAGLGLDFVALTPGSSFRGLHDSLVNHRGARGPRPVMFIHEEHAVAAAHGYAKAAGRPMAVALHSNVGLMHASMAVFNAWCDRVPVLMLGAQGPLDAMARRPWVDWVHTSTDLGALVRGYTKWDNQPASLGAALEAIVRAHRIACAAPAGPVYVCLDQTLQEQPALAPAMAPLDRFPAPQPGRPAPEAVAETLAAIRGARSPLLLFGRVSPDPDAWVARVKLAEATGADVLTDLKVGARFPTEHPAHHVAPGLSITAAGLDLIRNADVIVSFDWVDLGGSIRLATHGQPPQARVIHCSLDQYSHNGWSMDHQSLPVTDTTLLADPDTFAAALLALASGPPGARRQWPAREAVPAVEPWGDGALSLLEAATAIAETLAPHAPSYARLPIGWPGELCRFTTALDYLGYDGAGGIGSGPGMAVGAAMALRGTSRLPVAVLGDGDFLMGATAIWTAVHERLPLLVVVSNNRSFFNDELHQERTATVRGRPVENRGVAVQIDDPAPDLAMIARGQGAVAYGPVTTLAALRDVLAHAADEVRAGATVVVDVHVAREYGRGIPAAVLNSAPTEAKP